MTELANIKAKEINNMYSKLKKSIDIIDNKLKNLEDENDRLRQHQMKVSKELATENVKIESKKEEKEKLILNSDIGIYSNKNLSLTPLLDSEKITYKTKEILNNFLGKPDIKQGGSNLFVNIKCENIVITKKIEDPYVSFESIKKDIASQFNKLVNEIYFADQNDNILLGNMIVKDTLFPLDNVCLKSYIPLIKIINPLNDKIEENDLLLSKSKISIKKINKIDFESNTVLKKNEYNKYKNWLKSHKFELLHFTFLIIFILLYILSTISLVKIDLKYMTKKSFDPYINSYFTKELKVSKH